MYVVNSSTLAFVVMLRSGLFIFLEKISCELMITVTVTTEFVVRILYNQPEGALYIVSTRCEKDKTSDIAPECCCRRPH